MKILKKIRRNRTINIIVRWVIKSTLFRLQMIVDIISKHWRLSGIIKFHIKSAGDFIMYTECDDLIVDSLFYNSYDEMKELELFSTLCKKANVIIDVGANTGLYSLIASSSNPLAKIFAFEPYPSNYKRLEYNLGLNDAKNVIPVSQAVGSYLGYTSFYVPLGQKRISQVSSINKEFSESHLQNDISKYEKVKVQITSLDAFIEEHNLSKVDVIKIDVESLEIDVLLGGIKSIRKYKPQIICEIFYSQESKIKLNAILKKINYDLNIIYARDVIKVNSIFQSAKRNYLLTPCKP